MNDLLVGLCSYLAIQSSNGNNACHTAVNQAYNVSSVKPMFDQEQKELEKEGIAVYSQIPYNEPLGAILFIGKDVKDKDYKIPLYNHVDLEYSNYSSYTCNLKWEF